MRQALTKRVRRSVAGPDGDGRLGGRRVVLTGASSGIGVAAARLFAREGADVALLARSEPGLQEAARLAEREGRTAHVIPVDVADRSQVEAAVNSAAERLGGIDVFVSNAAMAGWGPFEEMSAEDFDRTVAVSFSGAVHAIRAALPHLESSGGILIATGSIAGRVPIPFLTPYVAAKHALRGFLGALRIELLHRGSRVRVSMVHPGPIDTPFYNHATSAAGVQPKPLPGRHPADVVARALVECAVRPRAEVVVGGVSLALIVGHTLARPLVERVLASYGVWGARSRTPAVTPGGLWEPSGEGDASGGHGGRPSLWTALRLRAPRVLRRVDR